MKPTKYQKTIKGTWINFPRRVIFLDFDGVILTMRMAIAHSMGYTRSGPDPVACNLLRRCCDTGIALVLSTSHRDNWRSCKETLEKGNLLPYLHKDWRTNEIRSEPYLSRPIEIREWLKRHPEVNDFRILDDDPWNWAAQHLQSHAINCCSHDGMNTFAMKTLSDWAEPKRFYKRN